MAQAMLRTETGDNISFMFNPADLTIAKAATWGARQAKGRDAPALRFQGGQSGTVSLTITLDATINGQSVLVEAEKLLALVSVHGKLKVNDSQHKSARPPWVELHWGPLHAPFRAVVERIQVKYTYFAKDGTPLRAKVDLALKQYDDEKVQPRQNPTSFTPMPHTVHQVLPGETLDRVAAHEYGDPARWRLLAEVNGVEDPLRLLAGTVLVIPELPVRQRG
jgi:hypothetical protein